MTRAAKLRPIAKTFELLKERGPVVPKVVAHAPHVGVLTDVLSGAEWRLAGREAEYHLATSTVDRFPDGFDFCAVIRTTDVVDLHKIDAPASQQVKNGIVIFLSAWL